MSEKSLERKARHWYDLALLAQSPIGKAALADRKLLHDVVRHKKAFFASTHARYDDCLSGGLRLVPDGPRLKVLEADYAAMIEAGMFFTEPPPFGEVLSRLKRLQDRLNTGKET